MNDNNRADNKRTDSVFGTIVADLDSGVVKKTVQITLFVQSVLYSFCKLAAANRVDRHQPVEEIIYKRSDLFVTMAVFFFRRERFPYLFPVPVPAVIFTFKGEQSVAASDTFRRMYT